MLRLTQDSWSNLVNWYISKKKSQLHGSKFGGRVEVHEPYPEQKNGGQNIRCANGPAQFSVTLMR